MLIWRHVAVGYFLLTFPIFGFFELPKEYSHPLLSISSDQLKADARNLDLSVLNESRCDSFSLLMIAIIYRDHVAASTLLAKNINSLFALPETISKKSLKASDDLYGNDIILRKNIKKKKKRRIYDLSKFAELWKSQVEVPSVFEVPVVDGEDEKMFQIRSPKWRKASKTRSEGGGIARVTPREKSNKSSKASRTRSLPHKVRDQKLKAEPNPLDYIDLNPYVKGNIALHLAAAINEQFLTTTLLVWGDPQQIVKTNAYGNTPLHEAVLRGHWSTVWALLRGPLDSDWFHAYYPFLSEALNIRNSLGLTPLDGLLVTAKFPTTDDIGFHDGGILDLLKAFAKSGAHVNDKMGPRFDETPLEYCERMDLAKLSLALKALGAPHHDGAFQPIHEKLDAPLNDFFERLKSAPNLSKRELLILLGQQGKKPLRQPRSLGDIFNPMAIRKE